MAFASGVKSMTYNTIRLPRANLKPTRVFARVYTGLRALDAGSFPHAAFAARDAGFRRFAAKIYQTVESGASA